MIVVKLLRVPKKLAMLSLLVLKVWMDFLFLFATFKNIWITRVCALLGACATVDDALQTASSSIEGIWTNYFLFDWKNDNHKYIFFNNKMHVTLWTMRWLLQNALLPIQHVAHEFFLPTCSICSCAVETRMHATTHSRRRMFRTPGVQLLSPWKIYHQSCSMKTYMNMNWLRRHGWNITIVMFVDWVI